MIKKVVMRFDLVGLTPEDYAGVALARERICCEVHFTAIMQDANWCVGMSAASFVWR